ncbi:hypothetical protein NPIL_526501 [Nephila pilipes]|uniref:Uncharacterized protein n=1 Tax=Nephila pilipes TaxID=299642 RepID=A0A8X6NBK7_NEPPI|nr:hypothetical protein NPIL_526501 [Nephila pilipes]
MRSEVSGIAILSSVVSECGVKLHLLEELLDRCLPTTSIETYAASTSNETNVEKERAETLTTMVKESSKVSVGTQTASFSEVIDLLAQKEEAELKDLKAMLEEKEFVPENIKDDTKMKALTSFTRERFF